MRNFILILLLSFIGGCSSKTENPKTFIQKSKNMDLSILFNTSIKARNNNNNELHYYYSHITLKDDTLTIPSFEYFDNFYNQDAEAYNKDFIKLCKLMGVKENLYLNYSKEYAQKLDKVYKNLGAINISSLPAFGRFIEFTLDNKCKVYYLEDATTLNPYWREKFTKLIKADQNWYYECN